MKRIVIIAFVKTPKKTEVRTREVVPYKPGVYDFGCDYPLTKNVWKSEYDGYYFGRITINNDYTIDYLDEHFYIPEGCTVTFERRFIQRTIFVTMYVEDVPSL